ncbi:hypothetical protein Hdeb2414_s0102g00794071 [Helianthus debilis subsp. tardiflorus]
MEKNPSDVFVILQFGRYNFHEGKAYVSSSFQNNTLHLNESIDELMDFQKRLLEKKNGSWFFKPSFWFISS